MVEHRNESKFSKQLKLFKEFAYKDALEKHPMLVDSDSWRSLLHGGALKEAARILQAELNSPSPISLRFIELLLPHREQTPFHPENSKHIDTARARVFVAAL